MLMRRREKERRLPRRRLGNVHDTHKPPVGPGAGCEDSASAVKNCHGARNKTDSNNGSKLGSVRFDETVRVRLIPTRFEMMSEGILQDVCWSNDDFRQFRRDFLERGRAAGVIAPGAGACMLGLNPVALDSTTEPEAEQPADVPDNSSRSSVVDMGSAAAGENCGGRAHRVPADGGSAAKAGTGGGGFVGPGDSSDRDDEGPQHHNPAILAFSIRPAMPPPLNTDQPAAFLAGQWSGFDNRNATLLPRSSIDSRRWEMGAGAGVVCGEPPLLPPESLPVPPSLPWPRFCMP